MVKMIKSQIVKDFKHLRYMFVTWMLLLVLPVLSAELLGVSWNFPMDIRVMGILKGIALFLWIPLLIHADPAAGSTAFWLTRPVARLEMLLSKALYILLIITGPAVLVNGVYLGVKGIVIADILQAVLTIVVDTILLILLFWLVAALTGTFKRFALTVIIFLLVAVPVSFVLLEMFFPIFGSSMFFQSLVVNMFVSHRWMFLMQLLLFSGGSIIYWYLSGKTRRTFVLTIAAILFIVGYDIVLNVNTSNSTDTNRARYLRIGWSDIKPSIHETAALEPDDPRIKDFKLQVEDHARPSSSSGTAGRTIYSFSVSGHYDRIPDDHFVVIRALKGVKMEFSGRKVSAPSLFLEGTTGRGSMKRIRERMLETKKSRGTRLQQGASGTDSLNLQIEGVTEEIMRNNFPGIGTLSATIDIDLYQYDILTRLPVQKGSRFKQGSQTIEVTGIKMNPSGCILSVEILGTGGFFVEERDVKVVILNKKNGATMKRDFRSHGRERVEQLPGEGLVKIYRDISFSVERESGEIAKVIDREWIRNAELVFLKPKLIGRVTKPLRIEKMVFAMHRSGSILKTEPVPLSKIRLPHNADAGQVETYIRQIMTAALAKSRKSGKDIEIDMLAKVGPQHIELLGNTGILYSSKYYAQCAILRIAGPESKSQILNILDDYPELYSLVFSEGWDEPDFCLKLWKQFQKGELLYDEALAFDLLPWAMSRGLADAPEIAARLMGRLHLCCKSEREQFCRIIRDFSTLRGDYKSIMHQLNKYMGKFKFNKKTKKFIIVNR
ncbi:MAG: hypothetical protein GY757_08690 [bacterium]|nr:hypothetical protein [bacterium]